jgi:hypothetical protein
VLFSKCIFDTWVTSAHCSIVRIPTFVSRRRCVGTEGLRATLVAISTSNL